jgi:hypothetical protein
MPEREAIRTPDWSVCGRSGCFGVRRDGQEVCLAHVGAETRKTILAALKPGAEVDLRGTPIDAELLDQLLAALRSDDGPPVPGDARFDRARFSGHAGFGGVQFSGDASFPGAQFSGRAEFSGAQFNGDALFSAAQFSGDAGFSGAQFNGRAGFSRAQFSRDTWFPEAQFSRHAWFPEAQFSGRAGFRGAQFSGDAEFGRAQFSGDAWFPEAQFSRAAGFRGAQFSGDAEFGRAQFSGDAGFAGAQFSRDARFDGAQFAQSGVLGPLLATTILVVDRARFQRAIVIEVAAARLSCVETTFENGATMRVRFAEIVLDGAVFAKSSTLAYAEDISRRPAGHPSGPGPLVDEFQLHATGRSPWPRLLSLRRVDVSTLVLADIDLSACLFHGAHHLDQLRIEGARPFATGPGAWRVRVGRWWLPVWWRWSRRQTLAEEHHWRSKRPTRPPPDLWRSKSLSPDLNVRGRLFWGRLVKPDWHGPACQTPEWVEQQTMQRAERLRPGRVTVLYRSLRKAREDSKDEPGAADFYYGEMEMRRKAPATPWPERFILWWYWLVSGYGLRGLRALASLAVVVVGFAGLLHVVGFSVRPSPSSLWGSVLYAASSTLSIGDDQVRLTGWGKLLRIMLRVAGPVLLGLTLLSIRNRVKR